MGEYVLLRLDLFGIVSYRATLIWMNLTDLLSSIESEIATLQQARALLTGTGSRTAKAGRPAKKKHTMSAEGRARIAAAQRKRWAKQKRAAKK